MKLECLELCNPNDPEQHEIIDLSKKPLMTVDGNDAYIAGNACANALLMVVAAACPQGYKAQALFSAILRDFRAMANDPEKWKELRQKNLLSEAEGVMTSEVIN